MSRTLIPKKSLGQHWLEDEQTLQDICNMAELNPRDTVLEIGPGLGGLTKLLCAKAGSVIAIELDNKLANQLGSIVKADNLLVVNESILKFDLTTLPVGYKLVANIPYYLTSNLLRMLSESNNPPSLIVLLVQKEVAERVCAAAGDMSLLSVTTQFYWEVGLGQVVKAAMFNPAPKVDSQVMLLIRRPKPPYSNIDNKKFFRLVRVGFSARRKTLENSLANGFRIDKARVAEILNEAQIDPNTRPQMLGIDQWYDVYKVCLSKKLI